eukprot:TRINITY_DN1898_c0_g1_i6.p1 TRINITY_DN1898_c0_g1~~TRINITY_DN1898_c0_g1_i6.p1  ORF type:complete len:218 (+),score=28.78 TRINITY_DN1898_c0_g1_i6:125-778(+)
MEGGCGGSGGGNDAELVSKTLQVEHKLFYFDLKENPRGRYLKISEKTAATRSTIILPVGAIVWFLDLFDYYVNNDDQEVFSKELQLDAKVFYFDIGENKRGRFLKISEASVNRNRSTIIVPAGSGRDEGWAAFRNILAEINDASQYIAQNQVYDVVGCHIEVHLCFRPSLFICSHHCGLLCQSSKTLILLSNLRVFQMMSVLDSYQATVLNLPHHLS